MRPEWKNEFYEFCEVLVYNEKSFYAVQRFLEFKKSGLTL